GERTAALRMLAQEFLQMVKKQQDHALPLDVHISELAHTLALQMAIPEASAFCDAFAHWQTVIQCAYDALQTVGEELVAEHRLQESTVKGAEDLWDTQTVEAAEAVQISLMAVKEQLPWNEVPLAPEVRLWTDLATQLITRWIVMQMEGKLLTALVSFSDDLTTGTGKLWLKMMANRLLEAFRPPLPDRTALLPDALLLEPEDDRPTASAWKQIALLAYEGAKRDQEHEVDDINAPLFHLAVQLRDLIDGRSDSRIRVLVRNLVEQLQGADFLQEQTRQSLLTCAMETADLVEKSPLRRLRALLPSIVAQLSELPVEAAEAPSQGKKSDTPALFSLARKVQALAEEQVAEELALLWESVQLQIDTLEADPRVDDPDLLALLRQIPQGLSPLNLEVLQETLHQILPALGSRLRPEDGYFRDFYNGTNILLMLGMDWWRDVLPRMNVETNELPLSGVHWLYQRVCEANLELPTEALWRRIAQQGIRVDEEGDHSRAAWIERFQQRKEQLQTLLKRAIDLEEPLICSF
ncbi:MAG TPA: hypothetical protein VKR06_13405, partial [Ktedonosporobacter sp.]|nr:hypothetical protein [Ktedonosporobacter sp.]